LVPEMGMQEELVAEFEGRWLKIIKRKYFWWNKKESSGARTPKDSKESCIKHSKHIITEIIKIINKKY
jgi:hypothetical protein